MTAGRQGHSREDPVRTQQHIPVHLALPRPQGHFTGCVYTHSHTPPFATSPPPHTFPSITCPLPALLLSAPGTPWLRSPYPHDARSHTALALIDSPPLTTAERYNAHLLRRATLVSASSMLLLRQPANRITQINGFLSFRFLAFFLFIQ